MSELHNKNQETVKELFRLLNVMGNENDLAIALADHMRDEHRTLQASFWRLVKVTAGEYVTNTEGFTDLRNETALALAKDIDKSDNYPPFV